MTLLPDLAQLAAKALGAAPGHPVKPSASEDARAIQLVARAIRERRRREQQIRWAIGGIAAAASIAAALGLVRGSLHEGTPTPIARTPSSSQPSAVDARIETGVVRDVAGDAYVLHAGQSRAVLGGSAIGAGEELVVEREAHVAFQLPTGTRLTVDEGGDLTAVALGPTQLFRLSAGSVRADVHKLTQGERFLIRTPDAEIEVRGTSFRVGTVPSDPSCGAGTTTRLTVYEGVVVVRAGSTETRVPAGHVWPPDCGLAVSRPAPALGQQPAARGGTAPEIPSGLSRASRSQLAEENDLYARALGARERGDTDAALAGFEQIVEKYPSSALAENASAERMRLLAAMKSPRAAESARDYVTRYPAGFARADAETILAEEASGR